MKKAICAFVAGVGGAMLGIGSRQLNTPSSYIILGLGIVFVLSSIFVGFKLDKERKRH